MIRTIDAIYENGSLRLLEPLEGLAEHSRIKVTIEMEKGLEIQGGQGYPESFIEFLGNPSSAEPEDINALMQEIEKGRRPMSYENPLD
ncbi:MAG: antitoxin family protein [Planctomycetota bacterium]|nr:antitoxin family protein [Planctomycetota bacterium]